MNPNPRFLLLPFSWLYGLGVLLRNLLFDLGLLRETSFEVPVISVGNLSTGGTGKSPHVDWIVSRLLADTKIAVLSRGYGRKERGFRYVEPSMHASECGDESLQLKKKWPELIVAVEADRVKGIGKILRDHPGIQLILLDDAFQHRYVKPSLHILLIEYEHFARTNSLLPAGNQREPFSARKRAGIVIVTKTPPHADEKETEKIRRVLRLRNDQSLYFSSVVYREAVALDAGKKQEPAPPLKDQRMLLITGIARAKPLADELRRRGNTVHHKAFPDHHRYTPADMRTIASLYERTSADLIVTTEKDAMRLLETPLQPWISQWPVFYLPIGIQLLSNHESDLLQRLRKTLG